MLRGNSMVLDAFLVLYAGDFEDGEHALEMPGEQLPSVGVAEDHDVGVVERFGMPVKLLQLHVSPRVEGDVVEDHHDLSHEIEKIMFFD